MWETRTLRTLANEDLGTLAENDPLTTRGSGTSAAQGSAGNKLKAVKKFKGWRVFGFWFQARPTAEDDDHESREGRRLQRHDKQSRALELLVGDFGVEFDKDDILVKVRQAAMYAMAPEAVVVNMVVGRRDLGTCENDQRQNGGKRSDKVEWRK